MGRAHHPSVRPDPPPLVSVGVRLRVRLRVRFRVRVKVRVKVRVRVRVFRLGLGSPRLGALSRSDGGELAHVLDGARGDHALALRYREM